MNKLLQIWTEHSKAEWDLIAKRRKREYPGDAVTNTNTTQILKDQKVITCEPSPLVLILPAHEIRAPTAAST